MPSHLLRIEMLISAAALAAGLCLLPAANRHAVAGSEPQTATVGGLPADEALRLGERMYREGILPSGEIMQGYIRGDIPVDSSAFSCISCHMRAGLGSIEGGVTTPPTNGAKLYKPYYSGTLLEHRKKNNHNQYVIAPSRRPAYTDDSLDRALRGGVNPLGRVLDPVMPRYHLQDDEMAIMIHYLKNLSSTYSPGVDDKTIRFATVITEEVSQEDRQAMLEQLDSFVAARNNQAKVYAARKKYMGRTFADESDLAYRQIVLARWELTGPPETWRRQLEKYHRTEPVFALIGGITTGSWQQIHDFCETERLPCLFPITDFPVIAPRDWYTIYFSKGFYQEGESAARFIGQMEGLPASRPILQIVRDSAAGRALAAGFQNTWNEIGPPAPVESITVQHGKPISSLQLAQKVADQQPMIVLFWTGPEDLDDIVAFAHEVNQGQMIFSSAELMAGTLLSLPEKIRDKIFITYPYRLPTDEAVFSYNPSFQLTKPPRNSSAKRIASKTYSLIQILQLGLMHMKQNFYRDNLLDVISMIPDQTLQDYERFSFGPGQSYAAKGAYVVQVSAGPRPELLKKSSWVKY